MRTIHKHPLNAHLPGRQSIHVPFGARVLNVQAQGPDEFALSIWFDVEDGAAPSKRLFEFFVTGGFPPGGAEYISTHVLLGGQFVLHLFEVTRS